MAAGDFLSDIEFISPFEFAKQKVASVQQYTLLAARSMGNLFRRPLYVADMVQQADLIGFGSLSIAILTGFFTGAALALNSASTLERFGSLSLIAQLVSVGMIRQLGPVITALMVAGRNASGMASELGSMVVTEQIDAMRALGTDPIKKLVTPRVLATVFMLFFLTIISDLLGLFGGSTIATLALGLDWHQYWTSAWQVLHDSELTYCGVCALSDPSSALQTARASFRSIQLLCQRHDDAAGIWLDRCAGPGDRTGDVDDRRFGGGGTAEHAGAAGWDGPGPDAHRHRRNVRQRARGGDHR